jgi:hypothetical protein
MSPELQQVLVPKITMQRMVAANIMATVAWMATANLFLEAYTETLRLYWDGHDGVEKQA